MSSLASGTRRRDVRRWSEPVYGYVYDFDISIHQIVHDGRPEKVMTRRRGVGKSSATPTANGSSIRPRPCIVLLEKKILALTTLSKFDPTCTCARTQHFLVAVNDTPAWPTDESPRFPIVNDWPKSQHSYVVAKLVPAPSYHYGLHGHADETQEDEGKHYYMPLSDLKRLQHHCEMVQELRDYSTLDLQQTCETHDELHARVLNLSVAHSPGDLDRLNFAYNRHVQSVAIANKRHPPPAALMPPALIPPEYRQYLPLPKIPMPSTFNFKYPLRISYDLQDVLAQRILSRTLSRQRNRPETDSAFLTGVFSDIVDVAMEHSAFVHPAFSAVKPELLSVIIAGDAELVDALWSAAKGETWAVQKLLNFVYQSSTL